MTSPQTLVFDLDGTLIETAPDLTAALNAVLAIEGLPRVDPARTRTMIGRGARAMISRALSDLSEPADDARLDRMLDAFLAHYGDNIAVESHPYPGLLPALDQLEEAGWRFAVCTNKREPLAVKLLEALGIAGRFGCIAGPDTFGMAKPDPRRLDGREQVAGIRSARSWSAIPPRTSIRPVPPARRSSA